MGWLPGEVMFCTRGLTRASQQVLPSAWAASSSGRKRSAKFCSWRKTLFSLEINSVWSKIKGTDSLEASTQVQSTPNHPMLHPFPSSPVAAHTSHLCSLSPHVLAAALPSRLPQGHISFTVSCSFNRLPSCFQPCLPPAPPTWDTAGGGACDPLLCPGSRLVPKLCRRDMYGDTAALGIVARKWAWGPAPPHPELGCRCHPVTCIDLSVT